MIVKTLFTADNNENCIMLNNIMEYLKSINYNTYPKFRINKTYRNNPYKLPTIFIYDKNVSYKGLDKIVELFEDVYLIDNLIEKTNEYIENKFIY
jgi:hypothetical protein